MSGHPGLEAILLVAHDRPEPGPFDPDPLHEAAEEIEVHLAHLEAAVQLDDPTVNREGSGAWPSGHREAVGAVGRRARPTDRTPSIHARGRSHPGRPPWTPN